MSCMSPETMGIYTDRCLLFFDFSKHVSSSGFYKRVTLSYRLADWDGLTEALTRVDLLPSDISDADVEADWQRWKDLLQGAAADHIPSKKVKKRNTPSLDR